MMISSSTRNNASKIMSLHAVQIRIVSTVKKKRTDNEIVKTVITDITMWKEKRNTKVRLTMIGVGHGGMTSHTLNPVMKNTDEGATPMNNKTEACIGMTLTAVMTITIENTLL